MDEEQFLRVLDLFPRVRSASYCEEDDIGNSSKQEEAQGLPVSTANDLKIDQLHDSLTLDGNLGNGDVFWPRLREAVQKKLSPKDAAQFCDSFRQVHECLVDAALNSKTIHKALKTWEQR
ncbi:hypothetical protein GOP47_0026202 [Adiantum capillus-veneris]|nr:hypothetical protein GOP47_0026202 [Adiantum capillus-veneris]